MSNTYTPGPWKAEKWHKGNGFAVYANTEREPIWIVDCIEYEANANLIAAAPELLEAAEFLLNTTRMITENDNIIKGARTMLIKALNKARGF